MKKVRIGVVLVLVAIISSVFSWYITNQYYQNTFFNKDSALVCKRKIMWGNKSYQLPSSFKKNAVITANNPFKETWVYNFESLTSEDLVGYFAFTPQKLRDPDFKKNSALRFTHCTASAQGVSLSIKGVTEEQITILLGVNIRVYRFTDEQYDFDAVVQDLSQSLQINQDERGSIYLKIIPNYSPNAFLYTILDVNATYIGSDSVNLVSKDNGKTWEKVKE